MKNDNKSNENLDELLKAATENVSDEIKESNKSQDSKNKKSPKKVIAFTSLGLALFIGALGGGAMLLKNQEEFEDKTEGPAWVSQKEEEEVEENRKGEWEFDYPTEIAEWAKQPYNVTAFWQNEENLQAVYSRAAGIQGLTDVIGFVPSGENHGYDDPEGQLTNNNTSNSEDMFLEDGTENENFHYALREDYEKAFVTHTERLLNPVFGGWDTAQRANRPLKNNSTYETMSDMFTSEWWNQNVSANDYSKLPIVVDWEGNDWGGLQLDDPIAGRYGTFYGKILENETTKVSSEIIGNDSNEMPIIKFNIPVEYKAFGKNMQYVTKTGLLELTMQSNEESLTPEYRIVINNAKLTLY